MKKKIMSKTSLFIGILIFISLFKFIFGEKNLLIGVTAIIQILVLLEFDLTKNYKKNFQWLLFLNIMVGIASYLANLNIFLGLIINFISLFLIGYCLEYELTKILILPFGLQYIFLIYTPLTFDEMKFRMLSLIAIPFLVLIAQRIVNHNKIKIEDSELIDTKEDNQRHIKLTYSLKVAFLVSLTIFTSKYFNFEFGRWMTYTVFSITEFHSQNCKLRSKERVEGTLIGLVIIIVLFLLIKDIKLRMLIILISGYLNPFTTSYRDMIITVTVSAVAAVAITANTFETIFYRLFFVFIGIILGLLADKFIFIKSKNIKKER